MHRYEELEKQYYKNKYKKYIIIFMSVFVLLICFFIVFNYLHKKKKTSIKINVNLKKIIQTQNHINNKIKNKTIIKNKKNDVNTTKIIKKNKLSKVYKIANNVPTLAFEMPKIKPISEQKKINKKNKIQSEKKRKHIINSMPVIKENNINIKSLILNFNNSPSYDTAMSISEYFFNKKDYTKAKLWALKANNINPSNYQSWQMFAMILLKKNDTMQAKKILKIYLDDYGYNKQIDKLLRSIDE